MSLPLFKSCDYCRHRKKKCVVKSPSSRCADCEHLDLRCEFSLRRPSLKRRRISQRIASSLRSSGWPKSGSVTAVKDGDCQLPRADSRMAAKILLEDNTSSEADGLSTTETYWRHVHPFAPFVPAEMLASSDRILQHCLELAPRLSLHGTRAQGPPSTERLAILLRNSELSLAAAAGVLLLVLRVTLDQSLVQRASFPFRHL